MYGPKPVLSDEALKHLGEAKPNWNNFVFLLEHQQTLP